MELKATMKFDDKTVVVDSRTRYRLLFSKPLCFGTYVQAIFVEYYSITSLAGCGTIDFEHEGTKYRVNMALLDMITEVKPI
jgi:hypothetical protein